jgi:DNA-directed RNA polymerase subunit RPC12/RpoP
MRCTHCGGAMLTLRSHIGRSAIARELRCSECGAQRLLATLGPIEDEARQTAIETQPDERTRPRRHRLAHARFGRAR